MKTYGQTTQSDSKIFSPYTYARNSYPQPKLPANNCLINDHLLDA